MNCRLAFVLMSSWVLLAATEGAAEPLFRSHPPMRPLPVRALQSVAPGPKLFVDAARGDDAAAGTKEAPWRTLAHALRQLKPGDTLYLRGGTYYERPALVRSGTAEAPITISSYPGELAVIDGGLREFFDRPAESWQPLEGGADGECVSTKTYPQFDDHQVPHQFLPAAWEPLWGIEEDRPIALGHFGDSLVALHGYRRLADLRATSELRTTNLKEGEGGTYCGPGLWFNRETGRVHARLAHNQMPGLGDRAYRGETDPRKLPLVVVLGFGGDVLRISGIKHVQVENLLLRGATGSPMIHLYGSENVRLDRLAVYGGFPALLVNASKDIRVTNSAFRGLAAPWSGRAHMKYLGTPSYQIVFQNNQPVNENIEIAWCELTDDHDCAFFRYVKNLQFHHNLVDNFNDDGLECGPKLRDHTIFIHHNRIGACLGVLQQHEIDKDESPLDHAAGSGVYVFRNVIDARDGVYYHLPAEADPSGEFLHHEGHLVSDHGGPIWPVFHVYHNTFLRRTQTFRDYFLFGLGTQGLRNTERDVLNNILVQSDRVPGVGFAGVKEPGNVREGGNLLWGMTEGPALQREVFGKFRTSPLFVASRKFYEPGLTTNDLIADPKFTRYSAEAGDNVDLTLQSNSPAIDAGQQVPAEWPDPLRAADKQRPDLGAIPSGTPPWGVGIDGRISLFTGEVSAP